MGAPGRGRLRRLAEELEESGLRPEGSAALRAMLVEEIDHALRPPVHERRVPSGGTILEPATDPATWGPGTDLAITRMPVGQQPLAAVRRFADGISSWVVRRTGGGDEWMVFDRPAGSERDLVVQAEVYGATIVQRHPAGSVRVVGGFGVLRWEGLTWHHEPPVGSWIDVLTACPRAGDAGVLEALLEFAVHDLGSLGIGSLLVYRPEATPGTAPDDGAPGPAVDAAAPDGGAPGPAVDRSAPGPAVEQRLPTPPPLHIRRPGHLGPLRHALAQVDGAAILDGDGVVRSLGARLVPSALAERTVEPFRGTRHTAGRRYSRDDPHATVVAVSEDGPVTVLRDGKVLGSSDPKERHR